MTRNYGGLGLGLSIANYFTGMLEGTLTAESKPGTGSTFSVTLDLLRDNRESPDLLYDTLNVPPEITQKIKVLLVDDDPFQQKMGKVYLSDWNVTLAENGQQAIDFLETQKFDIILMDIRMPVLDGITTTIIIREKYGYDQKIVALSGESIRESIEEAFRAGMDGFISKPYDKDKLILNILSTLDIDINQQSIIDNSSFDLNGMVICDAILNPVVLNATGKASIILANNPEDANVKLKKNNFDYVIVQVSPGRSEVSVPASAVRQFQPNAAIIAMSNFSNDKNNEFTESKSIDSIVSQEELFTGNFFQKIKEIVLLKNFHPSGLTEISDKVYHLSDFIKNIGNNPDALKEIIETYLWFMPDYIKQFRQYSTTHDTRQLSNIAHSVKSITKQFRISSIHTQIEMLENNANNGLDEETINRMIDEVCNVLELSIIQMTKDFGEKQ
ncbi:MAG: response regulator [Lentimicrobium sp.]|nr:response regulator [Lentimicrobium sp.]